MKKRLLLLTTILSLILLGACGGGEKQGESSGESNDEAKRISIATTQTEDSHYGAYLNTFKEEVEKIPMVLLKYRFTIIANWEMSAIMLNLFKWGL